MSTESQEIKAYSQRKLTPVMQLGHVISRAAIDVVGGALACIAYVYDSP